MALTAGIDAGAKNTKVVILKDGQVIGRGTNLTGFDQTEAVEKGDAKALAEAATTRAEGQRVC